MKDSAATATVAFRRQTAELAPADVTAEMLVAVFEGLEVAPRVLAEEKGAGTTSSKVQLVLLSKTVAGRRYRVRDEAGSTAGAVPKLLLISGN